jgi:subtilisin-like proprotein convertase family protein
MPTRIVLVVLAALLALPLAPTASPVGAKNRARTVTRSFRNASPINLPMVNQTDPVAADVYPSTIVVSGLKGEIRDVDLRLNGFTHSFPSDVDVLLVGPGGQTAIVMANVGGAGDVADVTLRLDDGAAAALPDDPGELTPLQSGTYRPTNAGGSAIAVAAPAPPVTSANAALSVFDGTDPSGTWRLFVRDEAAPADPGAVTGGWTLEIETRFKAKRKKR